VIRRFVLDDAQNVPHLVSSFFLIEDYNRLGLVSLLYGSSASSKERLGPSLNT